MRNVVLALSLMLSTGVAHADLVEIDVELDSITFGHYRLRGQSAFIQTRTGSSTSGGQLDGVESSTTISFLEAFPPPTLADYLGFAYFGIVEIVDLSDSVIDTSLVVAFDQGFGVGDTIDATFGYDEATLVAALTGGFDSPEFLDMLDLVPANASTLGDIAVPPIGRAGTTLDLVGFINGETGMKIGTLRVTVVPEPGTLALFVLGALCLLIWRRR